MKDYRKLNQAALNGTAVQTFSGANIIYTGITTVAELWRAGKHDEARRAVPLDLGRLTNLLGTPDIIAERVSRYRAAGITTLLAKLEGGHEHQLTILQRLVAIAESA